MRITTINLKKFDDMVLEKQMQEIQEKYELLVPETPFPQELSQANEANKKRERGESVDEGMKREV
jgi:hypothetical protein